MPIPVGRTLDDSWRKRSDAAAGRTASSGTISGATYREEMTEPVPFLIHVPDAELDDLHERLKRTRFLPDSGRDGAADPPVHRVGEIERLADGCEVTLTAHSDRIRTRSPSRSSSR
jgi:hypothetical protein